MGWSDFGDWETIPDDGEILKPFSASKWGQYLEAIDLALCERELSKKTASNIFDTYRCKRIFTLISDMHNRVQSLAYSNTFLNRQFADDNGGTFAGLLYSKLLPITGAEIMAQVTDPVSPNDLRFQFNNSELFFTWIQQQKQILDMLVWRAFQDQVSSASFEGYGAIEDPLDNVKQKAIDDFGAGTVSQSSRWGYRLYFVGGSGLGQYAVCEDLQKTVRIDSQPACADDLTWRFYACFSDAGYDSGLYDLPAVAYNYLFELPFEKNIGTGKYEAKPFERKAFPVLADWSPDNRACFIWGDIQTGFAPRPICANLADGYAEFVEGS